MTRFKHWLFCTLFPDEAGTLHRYRIQIKTLDQWFCGHIPAVSDAARWLKHNSEAKDDPNDPPTGLGISELRAKLMAQSLPTAEQRRDAHIYLRDREVDISGAELDALLKIFGLSWTR